MSNDRRNLIPGRYGSSGDRYSYSNDGPFTQDDYTRLTQLIRSNILKIQQNVQDIRTMVDQLLDTSELTDNTYQLLKVTTKYIKEVEALSPAYSASALLMTDFSDVLHRFLTTQRDAAAKEKESMVRVASDIEDQSGDVTANLQGPQVSKRAQISEQLEEIEERHAAIEQLEADIIDITMVFKDLVAFAHEHGDMTDELEEANVVSVEVENQPLIRARTSTTKSAKMRKLICATITIFVIALIALIIYFSTKGN